jgi:alkanesulfonate monooxygenase SsuD/methylene tetrahydromethanopterin reductase-like flavin-dependent oxidoreductase (luciferase family)
MQYGLYLPNFDPWGKVSTIVQLAREAEAAGWDGLFMWDDFAGFDVEMVNPWVALAAVATATTRLRLGALITPLPRRRPWNVARETVTLDHLSNGRLVVGVGTGGGDDEWAHFGEETNHKARGDMLDEALEVITGLWSGETYSHTGRYYHIHGTRFLPAPLQQPRIPIWVGGVWPNPRPLRRMARWDGMFPGFFSAKSADEAFNQFAESVQIVRSLRDPALPFDVVALGATPLDQPEESARVVRAYAAAGATWWLESIAPMRMGSPNDPVWSYEQLRAKVLEGPPRI